MKQFIRFLLITIVVLLIAIVAFYFWASSPQLSEKEYSKLITNNYEQKIDNDSIYSIVTYNIGYLSGMTNNLAVEKPKSLFDTNLKKVTKLFDSLNVDIIAFQEIDFAATRSFKVNQQNEIAKLGYNYIAQAVNWDKTYMPFPYWPYATQFGNMLSGQSIISKYPLADHERIVLERVADDPFYRNAFYLERLAQVTKATIEDKEVVLINVHLEAFDKPTRAKQFKFVLELFKKYASQQPTILLGDFNSPAQDSKALINQLFETPNIGNAAFNKDAIENTFDSRKPNKRIDYIFYTKNSIEYLNGKVLTEFGQTSDHLPVYMEFRLKQSAFE